MRFPGTLGAIGLGYTESKVVNGVPAVLIGDTYLPANVIVTDKGGYPTPSADFAANKKAWYEVWQNGAYVGYLRPGGNNGRFVVEGSPVVWPTIPTPPPVRLETPVIAPQAQKAPEVVAVVPPPAIIVAAAPVPVPVPAPAPLAPPRAESIPVIQTGTTYVPATGGGGSSIIELPTGAPPANAGPADTAEVIAATPTQAGMNWIGWALLLGAGVGLLRGKSRGKRRRSP